MDRPSETQRRELILELCGERGELTVRDAATELEVSEATIRRDFSKLVDKEKDKIKRERGKIVRIGHKTEHEYRLELCPHEKNQIAEIAARFVFPNTAVFFDSGTTIECFVRFLLDSNRLEETITIYTASMPVVNEIMEWCFTHSRRLPLNIIGGSLRYLTQVATGSRGWLCFEKDRKILDIAFIGIAGIDESGFLTQHTGEMESKSEALARAKVNVFLTDSSKFTDETERKRRFEKGKVTFANFKDANYLVVDSEIPDEWRKRLEEEGVTVYTPDISIDDIGLDGLAIGAAKTR